MTTILVAGGATGIGRAAVDAFRGRGDAVMIADVNEAGARAAASSSGDGDADWIHADLSDPDVPREAVEVTVARFGGLDAIVVTAGLLLARPIDAWTVQDWDRSLAVNLRAPFLLAQAAVEHLETSPLGCMVLTSSAGAVRGRSGMAAYGASKAGLVNLAKALAAELSPRGVRVNCIQPGWVDTPFNADYWEHQEDPEAARREIEASIPLRRQADPEDLAGILRFLTSDESAYITGETIAVDGGYLAV